MAEVYLSVGSNIGNRQKFIRLAIKSIADFCKILEVSSTYETEPWGKQDQPKFLNLCLSAETSLKPEQLLGKLSEIETKLGRTRTEKWAEREIDIDILFYEDLVQSSPELVLPHPRIQERAFVLIPLAEIAPNFTHPSLKKSISRLTKDIGNKGVNKIEQSEAMYRVSVMGVLNVTPDSFSDGGELKNEKALIRKVREMIDAGADIIDIGGESTRPGHKQVEASEEINRVIPAIEAVRKISANIPISIDTQKSEVSRQALEAGANIINDISGLHDKRMADVVKQYNCQIILMRHRPLDEKDLIGSCRKQFEEIIENCTALGIDKEKLILDPGLGFGDLASGDFSTLPGGDPSANTLLTLSVADYSLGLPVLIGASRKRFLGSMSGQTDAKKRLNESLSFAVLAKYSGASIIRVHDVKETVTNLAYGEE